MTLRPDTLMEFRDGKYVPMPLRGPETYDADLDGPELSPQMLEELAELEERRSTTSPSETIEAVLMKWEENYEASKPQRWKDQHRWQGRENEEMRLVRIMHPHSFMTSLRRAGVDARVEDDPYGRLWLNRWSRLGRVGISAWVKNEATGKREIQTVTTLQYPYGPEFSIMRFNQYNVPTEEKYRGWRTALLVLIQTDVITEREALKAFGPAEGEAAHFYRQQTQAQRRVKLGLQV